jgi:hypothetical protein
MKEEVKRIKLVQKSSSFINWLCCSKEIKIRIFWLGGWAVWAVGR